MLVYKFKAKTVKSYTKMYNDETAKKFSRNSAELDMLKKIRHHGSPLPPFIKIPNEVSRSAYTEFFEITLKDFTVEGREWFNNTTFPKPETTDS